MEEVDNQAQPLSEVRLTKHLGLVKEFPPLYTGGSFQVLKNEKICFALKDSKICVFELETSKQIAIISQENEEVLCFTISPNQSMLAISNKNYLVRIFALPQEETGQSYSQLEQIHSFKTPGQMILEMNFDPSSKFIACGSADSQIKVFDAVRGFQTHNFTGHRGIITNLQFFPDNESLSMISSAEDCTIKVWDLIMRSEITTLKGHMALITSIVFSNDKSTLITSSKDGKLGFWNVKDNYKLLSLIKFSPQEEELNALSYIIHDNSPFLIVGGVTGALHIYDINKQKICYSQEEVVSNNEITKLFNLQKSNRLLSLNSDQQLTIFSFKGSKKSQSMTLNPIHQTCLYLDEIIDVKIIPDNKVKMPKKALVCSNNELLKVMDIESGQVIQAPGHEDIILCLDVCNGYFLSGSKDNQIRLWQFFEKESTIKCLAVFRGHNENVASVAFAHKKMNFFVSASQDNTIKVWDIQKFKIQEDQQEDLEEVNSANLTVMGHQKYINVVKVSPNDKLIASASQDKSIKIWSSKDLMIVQQLNGHKKGVWDIAFSPVDKLLVSASGDKTLKLWNLSQGTCIATLQGHQTSLVKVSFINVGLQLVSASVDGIVKVWNIKKQQSVGTFQMHEEKVWGMDISQDEMYMLTGGGDSTLKLWQDQSLEKDLEDKEKQLQRLQDEQRLSNLIRDQDFTEAALLAFRLNKLRDFYLVMNKIILSSTSQLKLDPVDFVVQDRIKFNSFIQTYQPKPIEESQEQQSQSLLQKVLLTLMKENKQKLLIIIRNLNSKNDYAHLSQHLLSVILPNFKSFEFTDENQNTINEDLDNDQKPKTKKSKKQKKDKKEKQNSVNLSNPQQVRDLLQIVKFYSQKHLERSEKGLKKAFYPDYVVSQMGIEAERDSLMKVDQKIDSDDEKTYWKEQKSKKNKDIKQNLKKKTKKRNRSFSDNLFEEDGSQKGNQIQNKISKRLKA